MNEIVVSEPGNYVLSHTPDGLIAVLREVDGDVEVVAVRVPEVSAAPRHPAGSSAPRTAAPR